MAKSKKKSTPRKRRKSSPTKKSVMTVRKKRRKKRTTALSTHRRAVKSTAVKRRRKKTGLLSDGGTAPTLKQSGVRGGMAFAGGAAYGAGTTYFKIANPWAKAGLGLAGFFGLAQFKMREMGAGVMGALGADVAKMALSKMSLNDGDMEHIEYVDPATLSDSGMSDERGNPIVMDRKGICYKQEGDTLHEMGDYYSLSDQTTQLQSVSMLPLMDEYSLSSNPYNLASGY